MSLIDLFAAGGVLLLLDQWSKSMVLAHVPDGCISWEPIQHIGCATNLSEIYSRDGAGAVGGPRLGEAVVRWLTI